MYIGRGYARHVEGRSAIAEKEHTEIADCSLTGGCFATDIRRYARDNNGIDTANAGSTQDLCRERRQNAAFRGEHARAGILIVANHPRQ
jgi:hypothetical protein